MPPPSDPKPALSLVPRKPVASVTSIDVARKAANGQGGPTDPTDPPVNPGCSPCLNRLELHHGAIIRAAEKEREQKSIAAQYGVAQQEIWKRVVLELRERGALIQAARRAA